MAWLAMFLGAALGILAAHQLYRLTGPHPVITGFIRSLKHYARWIIPGQKSRRTSQLIPPPVVHPEPRYADSPASGHEAQRANV